jgi:O-6-methylguanine DNA methyltransferase
MIEPIFLSSIPTPLGDMLAGIHRDQLCLLEFSDRPGLQREIASLEKLLQSNAREVEVPLHAELAAQLRAYFDHRLTVFSLPLLLIGTDFTLRVWDSLITIPFGQTRTYSQLAAMTGRPAAIRAAGRANGSNRLAIVIPCHRVIGSDGSLTGYAGGLDRKRALLQLEASG